MLRGHLPSFELLDRFHLLRELFSPFITAIKAGDLKAYDHALEVWETRLLELNLWLSLEKAKELCVRGLFRRVYVRPGRLFIRLPVINSTFKQMGSNRQTNAYSHLPFSYCASDVGSRRSRGGSGVSRCEPDL